MLLDRNGCVKLLDMGLAQFFDEGNSSFVKEFENGYVIGTGVPRARRPHPLGWGVRRAPPAVSVPQVLA